MAAQSSTFDQAGVFEPSSGLAVRDLANCDNLLYDAEKLQHANFNRSIEIRLLSQKAVSRSSRIQDYQIKSILKLKKHMDPGISHAFYDS